MPYLLMIENDPLLMHQSQIDLDQLKTDPAQEVSLVDIREWSLRYLEPVDEPELVMQQFPHK
jgi:hypothetical protein